MKITLRTTAAVNKSDWHRKRHLVLGQKKYYSPPQKPLGCLDGQKA